ncbi:putative tRNA(adenine(34)) deaminase [Helianthus annuus]|nr:putative tRNA(adenine(34)) deaminase [Helianthus annuus]
MHTIRSTPPLSSSFNHSPCLFHDTLLPKCSCSCSYSYSCSCCCYAANISVHDRLATVNPRFLHKGLSQSTLIQSSLCKRFIFQERRYQRFRGFVQKKKEHILSNVVDDCEVMLSLLTDEVGLECTDVKNRKKITKEKKSVGLGVVKMKSLKESENLELGKEGSFGESEGNKDFEVKSDCYYVGQTSSSAYKNDSRKDCIDGVVKMKYLKESENLDLGKEGSFGESEGNKDFEVKSDCYYVGQTSSSAYKNDSRKDCIDGVVKMKYLKESENLDMGKEGSFGESEGNKDFEVKSDYYHVGQTSSSAYKNDSRKDCIDGVVKMKYLKESENLDLGKEGSFGGSEDNKDFEVKSDCYCVGQTSSSEYKNDLRKDCKGRTDKVAKMKSLQESENLDLRKEGSFGESEGNKDIEVKSDCYYVGQTSLGEYKKDLRKDGKGCNDGVVGKIERRQESVREPEGLLEKDNVNGCYGVSVGASQRESNVSSDWRKKSEKKLNKELSQHESNASANIEPCCRKQSNEIFKITDETGSRMKYKRFTDTSNNDNSVVESTFTTENKLKVIPEAMVSKPTSTEDNKDDGSGTCGQKDGGSRHSSQGSGPRGPSDEMWHVTDASTQEPSEPDNTVQTSGSSENGEPVKTSNKSLWTVIGDMVRSHWKPSRSGSHTPTSGGAKGSSYFSTSSETWFSSREPDDSNDEDVKKSIIKGLDSSLPEGPSRKTCLPMIKESSFSLKRSPKIKNTVKTDPDQLTELKRRKLVHKDQVFKDDFDKWEETYNLENERQKEDEMFMREALLEAKRAADVWEVPVGAVLVKDGKIIARGYNMVEQLQDSTAHAEMICIRKASTVSSSWRLSDTTLYVTLEPCPMCAGAILQARIHTVVWGAPNKLLGADGSWVRLFCDGDGGSSSMLPNMPCAPPHPFHPNMAVRRGVLAAECAEVMQQFFRLRRKKKTEPEPEPPNLPSSISVPHHHQHHHSNFLSKLHHAFKVIFCL